MEVICNAIGSVLSCSNAPGTECTLCGAGKIHEDSNCDQERCPWNKNVKCIPVKDMPVVYHVHKIIDQNGKYFAFGFDWRDHPFAKELDMEYLSSALKKHGIGDISIYWIRVIGYFKAEITYRNLPSQINETKKIICDFKLK